MFIVVGPEEPMDKHFKSPSLFVLFAKYTKNHSELSIPLEVRALTESERY